MVERMVLLADKFLGHRPVLHQGLEVPGLEPGRRQVRRGRHLLERVDPPSPLLQILDDFQVLDGPEPRGLPVVVGLDDAVPRAEPLEPAEGRSQPHPLVLLFPNV